MSEDGKVLSKKDIKPRGHKIFKLVNFNTQIFFSME